MEIRRSTTIALMTLAFIAGIIFGGGLVYASFDPSDVNRDGVVNVLDVQTVVNQYLQEDEGKFKEGIQGCYGDR